MTKTVGCGTHRNTVPHNISGIHWAVRECFAKNYWTALFLAMTTSVMRATKTPSNQARGVINPFGSKQWV